MFPVCEVAGSVDSSGRNRWYGMADNDSIDVKVGRMDERLNGVVKELGEIKQIVQDSQKSSELFHNNANRDYVTKVELIEMEKNTMEKINEVRRNIVRNLIGTNLLTAVVTGVFMYLLQYYLVHRG